MENKKTFTITIVDNETGEVVHDRDDVAALIGDITYATDDGEGDMASVRFVHAGTMQIAATLDVTAKAIEEVIRSNPLAGMLYDLVNEYEDSKQIRRYIK